MPECPHCTEPMDRIEASGHYGTGLFLFQCPECLGIWVDGGVVGALSHDSALEADADIDFDDISTEPREIAMLCPRCEINLMEQAGGGLPEGLHIDNCTNCNGFWFDCGELMIYKSYMENKRKAFKKREDERRKKVLTRRPPKNPGGRVLRFLNTEVQTWRSMRLP